MALTTRLAGQILHTLAPSVSVYPRPPGAELQNAHFFLPAAGLKKPRLHGLAVDGCLTDGCLNSYPGPGTAAQANHSCKQSGKARIFVVMPPRCLLT